MVRKASKGAGSSDGPIGGLFDNQLAQAVRESAQQIWLAGMGAFNRAQAEGSKLFETLVRDGLSLEQTARKIAGHRATVVRDVVEGHVGQARERAADTWDKLEKVFEDRVQRALVKLGVPGRDDLNALTERVERLTDAVRKANGTAPARKAAAAAKPAPKKATKPVRKASKTPAKPARAVKARKAPKASAKATPAASAPAGDGNA